MDRFQEMTVFAAVVDAGSFVAAADALGMSKAAVSRHVAELESRLGVRLLHRTTRRLSLTEAGEVFHARCKELLSGVDEAEAEISQRSGEALGSLKVSVPVSFGLLVLAPLWPAFLRQHPQLALDLTLSDRIVDLVDEGFDLAIRIARLPSSSLVSRQLSSTRMLLCASPEYLAQHEPLRQPQDLAQHVVLAYSLLTTGNAWEFTGPGGVEVVRVRPRLVTNSGDTCLAAALGGLGIILQPAFIVQPALDAGQLVELLPDYRSTELGIYAVYPTRKHVPTKVRLLIDHLAQALAAPATRTAPPAPPFRPTRKTSP